MTDRTYKIHAPGTAHGTQAYSFFGLSGGRVVFQSRKLWRNKADAEHAARKWCAGS